MERRGLFEAAGAGWNGSGDRTELSHDFQAMWVVLAGPFSGVSEDGATGAASIASDDRRPVGRKHRNHVASGRLRRGSGQNGISASGATAAGIGWAGGR